MKTTPRLINHVAIVIDASGSMSSFAHLVPKAVQKIIDGLRESGTTQENRLTIYDFGSEITCHSFDYPVNNAVVPPYYASQSSTRFRDALLEATSDLQDIPTKHGDHAFLVYVITDGQDNASKNDHYQVRTRLGKLGDNWTIAVQVPNLTARAATVNCGVPQGNIEVWDTTSKEGFERAMGQTVNSMAMYAQGRTKGIRGSSSFYQPDLSSLTKTTVNKELDALRPGLDYIVLPVRKDDVIKPFIEQWTGKPYAPGSAYYELTKPETIQAYKQIVLQDRVTGKVFSGTEGRKLLGLPDYELKIAPGDYKKWRIYVQSSSVNRNLVAGTQLVVML